MFRASLCPSSGATTTAVTASGFPFERCGSSVVGRGRPGKPEAATAVYKLLMMGKRMPETCWAVFKRRAINLRAYCIWLVDLFECMMHGLTNLRLINSSPSLTLLYWQKFLTNCHWLAVRILLIITYIHGGGIAHSDYFPYYVSRFDSRKGRVIFFLVCPKRSDRLWISASLQGLLPREWKLPGREAASSAMVKNEWSCTAAPPVCLHDVY